MMQSHVGHTPGRCFHGLFDGWTECHSATTQLCFGAMLASSHRFSPDCSNDLPVHISTTVIVHVTTGEATSGAQVWVWASAARGGDPGGERLPPPPSAALHAVPLLQAAGPAHGHTGRHAGGLHGSPHAQHPAVPDQHTLQHHCQPAIHQH